MKTPYITTAVALSLAAISAILNVYVWTGFFYFVLSFLTVLALFWAVWLIFQYSTTFKQELEDRFKIFKANKINSGAVSTQQFNDNMQVFVKEFNKQVRTAKFLKIVGILFCFACAATFLIAMILR